MSTEIHCAACGKTILHSVPAVEEAGRYFCDKVCRADFRRGQTAPLRIPPIPARAKLSEQQGKAVRRLVEGVVSIGLGIALSMWSRHWAILQGTGYWRLFYGPVLWGLVALTWGTLGLLKARRPPGLIEKYMP